MILTFCSEQEAAHIEALCPRLYVINPNVTEMTDTTRTATNAASIVTTVATRLKKRSRRAVVTTTWGNRVRSAGRTWIGMALS
jgi:pyridoxal/pyridoxine/pyridoxamine kinase